MAETALAKKQENPLQTLRNMLESKGMQIEIKKALPNGWTPEKFTRVAITAAQRNPRIAECTARSVAGAIMECAQLGLEPDPTLGHCALVPLRNRSSNSYECNMWAMYRGYISLAMRTAQVVAVFGRIVREGDPFQLLYGTLYQIHHEPKFPESMETKNWKGAYAVIKYKDGTSDFEYMDRDRILAIKERSPAKRAGMSTPWDTDEEPMWIKCAIRKLMKRVDLSPTDRRLNQLATLDEYKEAGIVHKTGLGVEDYEFNDASVTEMPGPTRLSEAQAESAAGEEQAKPVAKQTSSKSPSNEAKKSEAKESPKPQAKPINAKQQTDLQQLASQEIGGSFDNWQPALKKLVKRRGFDKVSEITVDRYDAIVKEIKDTGGQGYKD